MTHADTSSRRQRGVGSALDERVRRRAVPAQRREGDNGLDAVRRKRHKMWCPIHLHV